MSDQGFKKAMLFLASTAVVLLAFGLGFLMIHFSPAGEPPSPAPQPVVAIPAPAVLAPGTALAPPADATLAVAGAMPAEADWTTVVNGCRTEQIGSRFHITGTTLNDSWNNVSGIYTRKKYPDGDITLSADIMVPKYTRGGMGGGGAYLRANSAQGDRIGILFQPGVGYLMQAWTTPQQFSAPVPLFGDESATFHHLKMQYQAATQTATGWVDGHLIGSVHSPLSGERDCSFFVNHNLSGSIIDVWCDHFEVAVPGADGLTTRRGGP